MNRSLHHSRRAYNRQHGISMVEMLVTMVILMVGLLGLAGLMMQAQRSEMESYQRVQALILLQDMVGRINANRKVAACYAFTTGGTPYLGTLASYTPACTSGTIEQQTQAVADMVAWDALLAGAAEVSGGSNVGAMIGGRGCVEGISATEYRVSVAWQGLGNTFANITLTCGQGLYGAGDAQRRVISLPVTIATLL